MPGGYRRRAERSTRSSREPSGTDLADLKNSIQRFAAARPRSGRVALYAFCVALLALMSIRFVLLLPDTHIIQLNDFPPYHHAARAVLDGHSETLYRPDPRPYTNLPVVGVLLAPLGALDYEQAWRVFWWINLASLIATLAMLLWALGRFFPPLTLPRATVAVSVFLAFAPVMRRCLVLGQTTPLMLLLFAGFYVACRRGRPRLGGALLGAVCVFKIPPMLLIPLLGLRRRLSVATAALAVLGSAVALSWIGFGGELMRQYTDRVILGNLGRAQAAFNNQSLDGMFMRLVTSRSLVDWVPVDRPADVTAAVWLGFAAIALLLAWRGRSFVWPDPPPDDVDARGNTLEFELGLGVTLMLLVFPVIWIHYYLFLALPLALLPFWWQRRGLPWSWATLVLFGAGTWLASGFEVGENAHYRTHEGEALFRALQSARLVGALLLLIGFATALPGVAAAARAPSGDIDRAAR